MYIYPRHNCTRSSTSGAATAFAIATSGSSNPRDLSPGSRQDGRTSISEQDAMSERNRYKETVISTACTMRVLNVLRWIPSYSCTIIPLINNNTSRHWVSKHAQDFENDHHLKNLTIEFLDDIIYSPNLLPAEHKAAAQLLRLITKEEPESSKVDLERLLAPPMVSLTRGSLLAITVSVFRRRPRKVSKLSQRWKLLSKWHTSTIRFSYLSSASKFLLKTFFFLERNILKNNFWNYNTILF